MAGEKQIVVLLIGPPGSGKSTFCDSVMKSSHRPWSRICQVLLSLSLYQLRTTCLMKFLNETKYLSVFLY